MTTVYLENNIEQKIPKIVITYNCYKKENIKLVSIQINKILSMLKRQFINDYTVNILSHVEFIHFKYIDRSITTSEYETTSDGYISSGKVFFYECKESDSQDSRERILSRVSNGRIRININENCLYNIDPLYYYIMNEKELKCKIYKMSSVNNQVFQSEEYFNVISKKKSQNEIEKIDDVCLIEIDPNFKCKFTGLTNLGKNKNFDKESLDQLKDMGLFYVDEFTKSLNNEKKE